MPQLKDYVSFSNCAKLKFKGLDKHAYFGVATGNNTMQVHSFFCTALFNVVNR